jgi:hypothetical protein
LSILKLVLVLFIFSFVVYVLKAAARLAVHLRTTVTDIRRLNDQGNGRTNASAEMVRCSACGSFVAGSEAITISSRGRAQTFCSHDCIRAHVKTA